MDLIWPRIVDAPRPGFFRLREYRRGPWVAACIWREDGDERPAILLASIMDEPAEVELVWNYGREITADDYALLYASTMWRWQYGWTATEEMDVNINDLYPSKYLKASDLHDKTVVVTIARVVTEIVDTRKNEQKPIVYFTTASGKPVDRGLVLNKTNANQIAFLFGPDTDEWIGKTIEMFPARVEFQGKMVEAIRVRPVSARAKPQQRQQPTGPVAAPWKPATEAVRLPAEPPSEFDDGPGGHDPDDEIPF